MICFGFRIERRPRGVLGASSGARAPEKDEQIGLLWKNGLKRERRLEFVAKWKCKKLILNYKFSSTFAIWSDYNRVGEANAVAFARLTGRNPMLQIDRSAGELLVLPNRLYEQIITQLSNFAIYIYMIICT